MEIFKYDLNALVDDLQKFVPKTAGKLDELLEALWSRLPQNDDCGFLAALKDLLQESTSGVLPHVAVMLEGLIDHVQENIPAPQTSQRRTPRRFGS